MQLIVLLWGQKRPSAHINYTKLERQVRREQVWALISRGFLASNFML